MHTDGDYISRSAAIKRFTFATLDCLGMEPTICASDVVLALQSIPAADVRPVRRGKWKNNHCSACGMMPMGEEMWECCDFAPPKFEWFMNFCPNCGADMREES